MDIYRSVRVILPAAVGSAIYLALLSGIYSVAPYADIPAWWSQRQPRGSIAALSWVAFVDVCGALVAAIPVAVVLALLAKEGRVRTAVGIGAITALCIGIGGLVQYGTPPSVGGWVVRLAQLISVLFSVAAVVFLIGGRKPA